MSINARYGIEPGKVELVNSLDVPNIIKSSGQSPKFKIGDIISFSYYPELKITEISDKDYTVTDGNSQSPFAISEVDNGVAHDVYDNNGNIIKDYKKVIYPAKIANINSGGRRKRTRRNLKKIKSRRRNTKRRS